MFVPVFYFRQIKAILIKEYLFEIRKLFILGGLLAFLVGVSYLIYFFIGQPTLPVRNLFFWMVFMFLSFFSASRSFEEDAANYKHYVHQMAHPVIFFLSKVVFLFSSLLILSFILMGIFHVFVPTAESLNWRWLPLMLTSCLGISLINGFSSLVSSEGHSKHILFIVISLPLVFPILGISYSISLKILEHTPNANLFSMFYPLISIDLLALALIFIIVPLMWKN
ncbi:MAG: hypothetical protein M3Q56_11780 [Bacteroidota bacterium]|nr:hypothetical protein [Bacteroidota bacterium]